MNNKPPLQQSDAISSLKKDTVGEEGRGKYIDDIAFSTATIAIMTATKDGSNLIDIDAGIAAVKRFLYSLPNFPTTHPEEPTIGGTQLLALFLEIWNEAKENTYDVDKWKCVYSALWNNRVEPPAKEVRMDTLKFIDSHKIRETNNYDFVLSIHELKDLLEKYASQSKAEGKEGKYDDYDDYDGGHDPTYG